ncbi:hypothetical protein MNQ95_08440 [Pseudoxanthomonas daejeonensis]|nr:hypothetical protein [Pseudoxanthomonas daejeonensis]UNK56206.1 hypothetical protein MNQ95_08440 [Pseudoxanthomonas daejeonensis]
MDNNEAFLKVRLGSARIEFKGDAALLKGGVLDLAKGLDRLQIPRVAESASALALELDAARALQDEARQALDSLSGMGEMESLRLQMAMDRISKMMSTLSNILKASSETANAIVRNIR